ncbi:hypothetical protein HanRHA438_Chr15g0734651 [Helianthus annuus]|nr:hypothetical protein HanRHA438_Chr15g0734651 [Helianthus annuus]
MLHSHTCISSSTWCAYINNIVDMSIMIQLHPIIKSLKKNNHEIKESIGSI